MLPGGRPPATPEDDAQVAALVGGAIGARLTGPLLLAVDVGALELPERAVDELVEAHRQALQWCLHLELRLLEVRGWFEAAGGVEHRVLKGPAVAHLDELDPSLRTFADLDLLVAAEDLDRAVAAITTHGGRRPWAERRPGYDRRFAKSVTLTCTDGVELDLHRSLADGVHGFRIPLERLFATPDRFDVGGQQVTALGSVHRLLHAAYHAVLGSPSPRLASLRDLAGLLVRADLQPDAVLPEARRWRGEAVLAEAVASAAGALTFEAPAWRRWADGYVAEPAEVAIIERQRAEGSALGRGKLVAARELGDRRARAAYAVALAWPSRAHLRSRDMRRRDLLR
jgi:hypothetical protein